MEKERPSVGIGVCVRKDGKILLQRRRGAHGAGTWCPPGGHLEMWESWEDCGRREVLEEAGVEIDNIRFLGATNDLFKKEGRHYITLFLVADWKSGEARVMEPAKCDGVGWFSWSDLPKPPALFFRNFIEAGYNPFNV